MDEYNLNAIAAGYTEEISGEFGLNAAAPSAIDNSDEYGLNAAAAGYAAETATAHGLNAATQTYNETRAYVTINGVDMRTLGLELTSYKIGAPVPAIKLIEVPGRSGKLDYTTAATGRVPYTGREISMTFHVKKAWTDWHTLITTVSRAIDGKESKVIFDKDPSWYYKGRFSIDFIKSNPVSGDITISCKDCNPFKLRDLQLTGSVDTRLIGAVSLTNPTADYLSPLAVKATWTPSSAYFALDPVMVGGETASEGVRLTSGKVAYVYVDIQKVLDAGRTSFNLYFAATTQTLTGTYTIDYSIGEF